MIYLLIFLKKLLSNVFVLQKRQRHKKNAIFIITHHFISCRMRKIQGRNCDCPVIFTFK